MSVDFYSPHYTTANARLEALAVPAVSPLPEAIKFLSEIIKETAAQKIVLLLCVFLKNLEMSRNYKDILRQQTIAGNKKSGSAHAKTLRKPIKTKNRSSFEKRSFGLSDRI